MIVPRRSLLVIAAVVDIALHARPTPVSAKALAQRHAIPPRHLETALQALVRGGILKGVRGPRGGYELARERRRITAAEIVRATLAAADADEAAPPPASRLVAEVIGPMTDRALEAFLAVLDGVTVEELCQEAERQGVFNGTMPLADFTI